MDNDSQTSRVEFLSGEKVYLRPIESADLTWFYKWANDPETRGLTGEIKPSGYSDTQDYYEKVQKESDRVWLAVVMRETQQVIGETG